VGAYRLAGKDAYKPGHPLYAVSWLPLAIPDGAGAKYYDFELKSLMAHYNTVNKQTLLKIAGWQNTFAKLREMKQICLDNGIRLIIVYAPDKPHVLPPLVKNKLSAQQVHSFITLKKKNLPLDNKLIDVLLSRLDVQESTMKEFCWHESIEFVSLTEPLRQGIMQGTQCYFTYDQHWTPPGHEIVAQVLNDYLKNSQNNVGRGLPRQ
jgi:hypothetical protein